MGLLDGKAVVVTGSGRGLGAAYATLAADNGAAVVINDIDADVVEQMVELLGATGAQVVGHVADVADWDDAAGLVQRCVQEFGALDGLVNNAGQFSMATVLEDQDVADVRAMFDVNIAGTYYAGYHALRQMHAQGSGSLVNVSSGAFMGFRAGAAYAASKGAVAALTITWAMELAESPVRVNAICPQARTRMVDTMFGYFGLAGEALEEAERHQTPPADNAPLVVHLLSDRSAGMSGQILRIVDGDLGIVTHSTLADPSYQSDKAWTVDSLGEKFADDFDHRPMPLGVVRSDGTTYRAL